MDKSLRNTLRNVVTQCRRLLEESIADTLEGQYGVYGNGKVDDASRMTHLPLEDQNIRERILIHLNHIKSGGFKDKDAVEQLIRESAFTHLNRLAAYKMMEKRGLIRETVSRGIKSQGVMFYLADHPDDEHLYNGGKQDVAYRHFLTWQGEQLSSEIGVLFSPHDVANGLFPPQRVLDEVLTRINSEELQDIWSEDEAIGWIYQYFTPKELRDKARGESQTPRNSYELAFRNQFFTPRYVVEFLTDNTLGRIWYEMRRGETSLTERCHYLVRRPVEIFLNQGEPVPEMGETAHLPQEEQLQQPVYIPYRPKKDPRSLRIIDPACGSGHFLLYCFDLLAVIYEEAYDDSDSIFDGLRNDYRTFDALRRAIPGMILANSLHGIDIDPRATQIAALALWLRGQRYYQEIGLKRREDRPKITRSNIVCAEPMPGDAAMLEEFVASLNPPLIGNLVKAVFNKMKLAGEAGSLLKIEEELQDAIAAAKKQFMSGGTPETLALFPDLFPTQSKQQSLFDLSGIDDATVAEGFFSDIEKMVLKALESYARTTAKNKGLQRQLFADDATQGFAFIDICRNHYDVVLMNPPFGQPARNSADYLERAYPNSRLDIYATFVERGLHILSAKGYLGAITSRTGFYISSLSSWRKDMITNNRFEIMLDLGGGVLDSALVSTAAYVIEHTDPDSTPTVTVTLLDVDSGEHEMILRPFSVQSLSNRLRFIDFTTFLDVPGSPFPYWLSSHAISLFKQQQSFKANGRDVRVGVQTGDNFRLLQLYWEIPSHLLGKKRWVAYAKGGDYSPYYRDIELVIDWEHDGKVVKELATKLYGSETRTVKSQDFYFRPGLTFTIYTVKGFNIRPLPAGCIFDVAGSSVFVEGNDHDDLFYILGYLSSDVFQFFISAISDNRKWQVGLIQVVPWIDPTFVERNEVVNLCVKVYHLARGMYSHNETEHTFYTIPFSPNVSLKATADSHLYHLTKSQSHINEMSSRILEVLCGIYELERRELIRMAIGTDDGDNVVEEQNELTISWNNEYEYTEITLSYLVGIVLGRWDIRFTTGEKHITELPNPFAPLPACPPGMLQGDNDVPLSSAPEGYPIEIQWDGLLVDDVGNPTDVIGRVRQVIEALWGERAESIEREACEILNVKSVRDYFRKPGKGGFWDDHIKRYSKSRRQAPIYWLLQSSNRNYALWLYYHRLDKDILYKALVNYVEPKIRLEEAKLADLRAQSTAAGNTGATAKRLAGEVEKQEDLMSELYDFRDRLKRAADLNLEPDLNDGVVLNIAPLHELVPWKVAGQYWDELLEGKYEWSSISKQLRAQGRIL